MKLFLLSFLLGLILFSSGCVSQSTSNSITLTNVSNSSFVSGIDKVEVIHFHATRQCYSCITIGKYAEETMNTYFADELKSGKVSFAHINVDLPENKELATKYGAAGASLWIGVYDNGTFSKEENVNVWYKIDNKTGFMSYLKDVIEQKLRGK